MSPVRQRQQLEHVVTPRSGRAERKCARRAGARPGWAASAPGREEGVSSTSHVRSGARRGHHGLQECVWQRLSSSQTSSRGTQPSPAKGGSWNPHRVLAWAAMLVTCVFRIRRRFQIQETIPPGDSTDYVKFLDLGLPGGLWLGFGALTAAGWVRFLVREPSEKKN